MRRILSIVIFCLCCLLAAGVLCFSPSFIYTIRVDSEGWGSKFFGLFAVPVIAGSVPLLIASVVLYCKGSRRLDLASTVISGVTLGVVILAWVLVEPLRQWIIFGR